MIMQRHPDAPIIEYSGYMLPPNYSSRKVTAYKFINPALLNFANEMKRLG